MAEVEESTTDVQEGEAALELILDIQKIQVAWASEVVAYVAAAEVGSHRLWASRTTDGIRNLVCTHRKRLVGAVANDFSKESVGMCWRCSLIAAQSTFVLDLRTHRAANRGASLDGMWDESQRWILARIPELRSRNELRGLESTHRNLACLDGLH